VPRLALFFSVLANAWVSGFHPRFRTDQPGNLLSIATKCLEVSNASQPSTGGVRPGQAARRLGFLASAEALGAKYCGQR
jgi:hypothetical protein